MESLRSCFGTRASVHALLHSREVDKLYGAEIGCGVKASKHLVKAEAESVWVPLSGGWAGVGLRLAR
eukprot:5408003-Pleurochrysis_carterae.AAC.2